MPNDAMSQPWFRIAAVLSSREDDGTMKELVIQRADLSIGAKVRTRVNIGRIEPARGRWRRVADTVEAVVLSADGRIVEKTGGEINGDQVLTMEIPAADDARKLMATVKIIRHSQGEESGFFSRDTQEARVECRAEFFADTTQQES